VSFGKAKQNLTKLHKANRQELLYEAQRFLKGKN